MPVSSSVPSGASADCLDVVAVGNALFDVLVETDDARLAELGLERGSMTLVDEEQARTLLASVSPVRRVSGGSAANTLVGLVSLGGSAGFCASVADDETGHAFSDDLRRAGVVFEAIRHGGVDSLTGHVVVLITPDGERTMATVLGASILIEPSDLDAALFQRADYAYLEGYLADAPSGPDVLRCAMKYARSAGGKVALSLSDAFVVERHRELLVDLLGEADLLFANVGEARLLAETDRDEDAFSFIAELPLVAAITRGAEGSVVIRGTERIEVPAVAVDVVEDTTGAGDLFAAGFLFGTTHGAELRRCAELGALAASEIIGHIGARPEQPLRRLAIEQGLLESN